MKSCVADMRDHCLSAPRAQMQGVTLVELMVSVALGLVIMASLSTVLFDTAQLTKVGMSEVQTVRQFERTMDILETTIELAGFLPDVSAGVTKENTYLSVDDFKVGEVIRFDPKGTDKSNILQFRTTGYLGSSVDCLGNIIPTGVQVIMTLKHDANKKTLVCEVLNDGNTTSGVLMKNVVFLAVGHTGISLGNNLISKMSYRETTPNDFLIRGVVIELVMEGPVESFSTSKTQKVGLFLDEEVSFESKSKITRVRRAIAIMNTG